LLAPRAETLTPGPSSRTGRNTVTQSACLSVSRSISHEYQPGTTSDSSSALKASSTPWVRTTQTVSWVLGISTLTTSQSWLVASRQQESASTQSNVVSDTLSLAQLSAKSTPGVGTNTASSATVTSTQSSHQDFSSLSAVS